MKIAWRKSLFLLMLVELSVQTAVAVDAGKLQQAIDQNDSALAINALLEKSDVDTQLTEFLEDLKPKQNDLRNIILTFMLLQDALGGSCAKKSSFQEHVDPGFRASVEVIVKMLRVPQPASDYNKSGFICNLPDNFVTDTFSDHNSSRNGSNDRYGRGYLPHPDNQPSR
ncbi:MAG: hypothetical protein AAF320_04050 [Myxococcota bacterium]